MNIDAEILAYASSKGLEAISTGGGCDYVVLNIPPLIGESSFSPNLVLVSTISDGSPDSVREPASITVFPDQEWLGFIAIAFDSTQKAIDAMADSGFRAWCLNELSSKIIKRECRADFDNAYLGNQAIDDVKRKLDEIVKTATLKWGLTECEVSYHPHPEI
jgi:hypothetical protein